ncbi:hypothetical protein GTV32_02755 [Gordonia sp. SID5947]|uniref:hypothetical protein n=1 Tax=Gordonia sp. SID5947 TaxID=2690315 RepID=UPI0013705F67|nr:hypothetical protein [Gordonia sp. SID5947]MYR05305.1 hypothetical protein [Gordonia sp. SID5947]
MSTGDRYREHVLSRYADADPDVLDEACDLLDRIAREAREHPDAHPLIVEGLMTDFRVCQWRLGMKVD